jgi:hypothetical protein
VTVQVIHPDGTIRSTLSGLQPKDDPGTPGFDGIVEVNHPGGYCWDTVTPDIRAGDKVRLVVDATGAVDEITVQNVTAKRPVQTAPDTVVIHGTADPALDPAALEQRLVSNPKNLFDLNGRRTLRATVAAGADGTLIIDAAGNWTPPAPVVPGLELAGGVVIVIALSILGSVVLSSTANGIAVFMLFGAGLTAGLLGTIGHALSSPTIERASRIAAWALPFEALYQDGLRLISSNASGLTGFLLQLGPFGGAYVHGWGIRVWSAGYLCVALALALFAFRQRDL